MTATDLRPIETCPRDGSWFEIVHDFGRAERVRYDREAHGLLNARGHCIVGFFAGWRPVQSVRAALAASLAQEGEAA